MLSACRRKEKFAQTSHFNRYSLRNHPILTSLVRGSHVRHSRVLKAEPTISKPHECGCETPSDLSRRVKRGPDAGSGVAKKRGATGEPVTPRARSPETSRRRWAGPLS